MNLQRAGYGDPSTKINLDYKSNYPVKTPNLLSRITSGIIKLWDNLIGNRETSNNLCKNWQKLEPEIKPPKIIDKELNFNEKFNSQLQQFPEFSSPIRNSSTLYPELEMTPEFSMTKSISQPSSNKLPKPIIKKEPSIPFVYFKNIFSAKKSRRLGLVKNYDKAEYTEKNANVGIVDLIPKENEELKNNIQTAKNYLDKSKEENKEKFKLLKAKYPDKKKCPPQFNKHVVNSKKDKQNKQEEILLPLMKEQQEKWNNKLDEIKKGILEDIRKIITPKIQVQKMHKMMDQSIQTSLKKPSPRRKPLELMTASMFNISPVKSIETREIAIQLTPSNSPNKLLQKISSLSKDENINNTDISRDSIRKLEVISKQELPIIKELSESIKLEKNNTKIDLNNTANKSIKICNEKPIETSIKKNIFVFSQPQPITIPQEQVTRKISDNKVSLPQLSNSSLSMQSSIVENNLVTNNNPFINSFNTNISPNNVFSNSYTIQTQSPIPPHPMGSPKKTSWNHSNSQFCIGKNREIEMGEPPSLSQSQPIMFGEFKNSNNQSNANKWNSDIFGLGEPKKKIDQDDGLFQTGHRKIYKVRGVK